MSDDSIRAMLHQLREELEAIAETGDDSADVVELDQTRVGRLSRMDAMQVQAMAKASVRRRTQTLQRIDSALKRLDDGEYGICPSCGEDIHENRLEYDPTVVLCIECAERAERQ